MTRIAAITATLLALLTLTTTAAACPVGKPIAEKELLGPKPHTFYSVDVLGPDVVKWHGKYLMYFSGNNSPDPLAFSHRNWGTGLATADHPLGPFTVNKKFKLPYLDGGTVAWHGRLWMAASRADSFPDGDLLSSRDGIHWRWEATIPQAIPPYKLTADYSLEVHNGKLLLWTLLRTERELLPSGLGHMTYMPGRKFIAWKDLRRIATPRLQPWEQVDLGAPQALTTHAGRMLLYTAMGAGNKRGTGLAFGDNGRWQRCDQPLIAAGAAPWGSGISIDASGLVERDRLYVYFAAGDGLSLTGALGGAAGVRAYKLP